MNVPLVCWLPALRWHYHVRLKEDSWFWVEGNGDNSSSSSSTRSIVFAPRETVQGKSLLNVHLA